MVAPKLEDEPIFERGTASDNFPWDYAPWAKTRTMPLEKRIFELGTSRRDCGLVPRSIQLISAFYLSKTNMHAKKVKTEADKI